MRVSDLENEMPILRGKGKVIEEMKSRENPKGVEDENCKGRVERLLN